MKCLLAVSIVLSLGAVLVYSASGSAQTSGVIRGIPLQVTATTVPKRDRVRPYTFTTTGRVIPPGRYCNPGETPSPGPGNCIRTLCPPGVTSLLYCLLPGRSVICSGIVTVRFQKVTTTISSRTARLTPNCTYRSSVSFRLRTGTRHGTLRVRVRFQGNPVMQPHNSATHTVRAG